MAQDRDGLMTVEEFNRAVNKWSQRVAMAAKATLGASTHGTGSLAEHLQQFVDKASGDAPAYKVKFHFDRYGVFRAYGAGRGYVVRDGVIVRGHRVRSYRDIQQRRWNAAASRMREQGWTVKEVNAEKWYDTEHGVVRRSRLDWIDHHIADSIEHLADVSQEYWGDDAAMQLLTHWDKMKIVKK